MHISYGPTDSLSVFQQKVQRKSIVIILFFHFPDKYGLQIPETIVAPVMTMVVRATVP